MNFNYSFGFKNFDDIIYDLLIRQQTMDKISDILEDRHGISFYRNADIDLLQIVLDLYGVPLDNSLELGELGYNNQDIQGKEYYFCSDLVRCEWYEKFSNQPNGIEEFMAFMKKTVHKYQKIFDNYKKNEIYLKSIKIKKYSVPCPDLINNIDDIWRKE